MDEKELLEQLNKDWQEFKKVNDKSIEEIKEHGTILATTQETLDKLQTALDESEQKISEIVAKMQKSGAVEDDPDAEKKEVFNTYLRKGIDGVIAEKKILVEKDQTLGGYLVPADMLNELIKTITEFSPVRQVARVITIGGNRLPIAKKTGNFAAVWVGETKTRSETTGYTVGQDEIPVHTLHARVDVSDELLEDNAYNLEGELNMEFSEQFAVAEGLAFVSGNGVAKPFGIISNATLIAAAVNSGDANVLTADGIINLFYTPKGVYANRGTWLMKRSSIQAVRKLKDSSSGLYLWGLGGLEAGEPSLLLGRPVLEAVDMPAVAANAYPIAFGDFSKGYFIVDRVSMTIDRIKDSATAATGTVMFQARRRTGGQVVLPEAIYLQKVAA